MRPQQKLWETLGWILLALKYRPDAYTRFNYKNINTYNFHLYHSLVH